MKYIKVPKNTILRDHTAYKASQCGVGHTPVHPVQEIILPKDIPQISLYGPGQIRPDGDRQPDTEYNVIARIMAAVNGMG